jgi:amino acid transporter
LGSGRTVGGKYRAGGHTDSDHPAGFCEWRQWHLASLPAGNAGDVADGLRDQSICEAIGIIGFAIRVRFQRIGSHGGRDFRMVAGDCLHFHGRRLEFSSMFLILILALAFLARSGKLIDPSQLKMTGSSAGGIQLALILAVFSFVGFESSTALGVEAKNPLHTIPRSVWLSVVIVGVFYIFMSYVMVLAFQGQPVPLDKSVEPFTIIARLARMPGFGIAIAVGAVMSQLGCGLASLNAAARVIYAMGQHGVLHKWAGAAHKQHSTPHIAVSISSIAILAVPFVMLLRGIAVLDIFNYLGSIATFGFLIAYIFIAIAGPAYLRRRGELGTRTILISILALFLLLMPLVGSVYPQPAPPSNYLPYVFLGMLGLGTGWFLYLRAKKPGVIIQMAESMEAGK